MINSDPNPSPVSNNTTTSLVPIGGIVSVLRSGDAYKAIGELVQRSIFTALSTAFPRNGSFSSQAVTLPVSVVWGAAAYGAGTFLMFPGPNASATAYCLVSKDMGRTWYQIGTGMPSNTTGYVSAYGAGVFVAILSGSSTMIYSADGVTWTARVMPGSNLTWTSVTYGGGKFVAVASGANICASSSDGITWTSRTMPSSSPWSAVAYGGSKFVAICKSTGAVAYSADGITWSGSPAMSTLAPWISLAYGNGIFVACQNDTGSGNILIATSTDGSTWTVRNLPIPATGQAVFGNGVFVAMAGTMVLTSNDGINWVIRQGAASATQVLCTYGDGAFVTFQGNTPNGGGVAGSSAAICYSENLTDSDYLYLSGTAGQFVRVK